MESNGILKKLITALVVTGQVVSGLTTTRGRAVKTAAYALWTYKTMLQIHGVNEQNGAIESAVESQEFPLNNAGISFARHFRVGANDYLLLMRKHSGDTSNRRTRSA